MCINQYRPISAAPIAGPRVCLDLYVYAHLSVFVFAFIFMFNTGYLIANIEYLSPYTQHLILNE